MGDPRNPQTCPACGEPREARGPCPHCGAPAPAAAPTQLLPAITGPPADTDAVAAVGEKSGRRAQQTALADLPVVVQPDSPTLLDNPAARPAPRRRSALRETLSRAMPLAALTLVAAAAVTGHAVDVLRDAATSQHETLPRVAPAHATADLPAVDAPVGLSDDNKEAVLSACWRISANPTHECQPSYLTSLGEFPARVVPIPALRVDRHEVSNADWGECVQAGACAERDPAACRFYTLYRYELGVVAPSALFGANRPATCVSYDEAAAFCAWRGMRLPTHDEWERIARSATDRMYPWGGFWLPALLNWGERDMLGFPIPGRLDGAELTAAVDAYPDGRSDDGVLNLLGNAAEWVQPDERDGDGNAATRGGSYTDDVTDLRITSRWTLPRSERRTTIGFRCVADAG
jgi:sulfatase modifying factor 1